MALEWNDGYKIGHEEIDAQHQQLFARVNDFLAARDKASLTVCAMSLFKYTREHFTHEESLMKKIKYPAIAAHVVQHENLISRLNSIAEDIANDTLLRVDLEQFLTDWLVNHIGTSDAKLAAYVRLQN